MAGERDHDDSERPPSDDGGEVESTIAMASPVFDSSIPSPISAPPPPNAGLTPVATYIPNTPAAPPAATPPTPPAPPAPMKTVLGVQRPPTAPLAFEQGGLAAPSSPKAGAAPGAGFRPPLRRNQTVIGVAPPAAVNVPSPVSEPPHRLIRANADSGRPEPTETRTAPRQLVPSDSIDSIPDWPDVADDEPPKADVAPPKPTPEPPKPAPPVPARHVPAGAPLFNIDREAPGADDARDAFAGAPRRSPLASTGFAGGASKATPGGPRPPAHSAPTVVGEPPEDDESTRAVPRSELEVRQDGAYVVRGDAVGDEATLAVGPGMNQAHQKNMAAYAATMMSDEATTAPNRAALPRPPDFAPPASGPAPGVGPGPSWNDYPMPPNGGFPPSNPQMQVSRPGGPSPTGPQPYMHGHPPSSPHLSIGGPMSVGPTMHSVHGSVHGHPYAANPMSVQPYGQPPWLGGGGAPSPKLSKQIIFLVVIGIICLAIFITGIVLFATTKF